MYVPQPTKDSTYLFEVTIAYEGSYPTVELECPTTDWQSVQQEIDALYPGGVLIRARMLGHIEPPSAKTLEELLADFEEIYARSKVIA